mmetsp:Transcript_61084/g.101573  ORF Transcript_61084/g.101573 Transcript_61084/m.101573 type:complete len:272 (+) Transcript_61084:3813-4628(+)
MQRAGQAGRRAVKGCSPARAAVILRRCAAHRISSLWAQLGLAGTRWTPRAGRAQPHTLCARLVGRITKAASCTVLGLGSAATTEEFNRAGITPLSRSKSDDVAPGASWALFHREGTGWAEVPGMTRHRHCGPRFAHTASRAQAGTEGGGLPAHLTGAKKAILAGKGHIHINGCRRKYCHSLANQLLISLPKAWLGERSSWTVGSINNSGSLWDDTARIRPIRFGDGQAGKIFIYGFRGATLAVNLAFCASNPRARRSGQNIADCTNTLDVQ